MIKDKEKSDLQTRKMSFILFYFVIGNHCILSNKGGLCFDYFPLKSYFDIYKEQSELLIREAEEVLMVLRKACSMAGYQRVGMEGEQD